MILPHITQMHIIRPHIFFLQKLGFLIVGRQLLGIGTLTMKIRIQDKVTPGNVLIKDNGSVVVNHVENK